MGMDNYIVAMNGIKTAARILGIEAPDVQFFYNKNLDQRRINSIFLKENYTIAFNESWLEIAKPIEVLITCFHECRHAFQWKVITGDYRGTELINPTIIEIWKKEMGNYNQVIEYYYDNKGQLRRENNEIDNYTYVYNYDDYGNILSQYYYGFYQGDGYLGAPGVIGWYSYHNIWKDQITQSGFSYPYYPSANYTIDYYYDGAGNLISMEDSRASSYDQSYTWEGRSLLTYTDGTTSASYTYNQNGIRDSKTVNGVTTTYFLDGTKVLYETDGTNEIYYTYDVNGTLLSMNYNGSEYYYVFNVLGDVTHLLDSNGNVVVEYRYDAYGNIEYKTNSTLANANPYRYRSYRYDDETGYYYLQSRYYNPQTGRFISADGTLQSSSTTLGHNMYSYVNNNPIMFTDPTGYSWKWWEKTKEWFTNAGESVSESWNEYTDWVKNGYSTIGDKLSEEFVVDLSYSGKKYKFGVSVIVNLEDEYFEFYPHVGRTFGTTTGLSGSFGVLDNYEGPGEYAGVFVYAEGGYWVGGGHCLSPFDVNNGAKAFYIEIAKPGASIGIDYYFWHESLIFDWSGE